MNSLTDKVNWSLFFAFALISFLCWVAAGIACWPIKRCHPGFRLRLATGLYVVGATSPLVFALLLWMSLGRPPPKTLGETRLWYGVFLPWIGLLVQVRWGMRWLNHYCVVMAAIFLGLNWMRPDGGDTTLMGFAFLTSGLLFGAIWAKEAWGHYWTWDPKETWSLLTWLIYLVYLHTMHHRRPTPRGSFALLVGAFGLLLVCWFGVNYFPSSATSVHTYSG